jgi:hypothetical protein
MNRKIQKIIENSVLKSKKQNKEFLLFGRILVFIQEPLSSESVDFGEVLETIEKYIPSHLFDEIDVIYVGQFKQLIDRELEAVYEDGAIFITNLLPSNIDYVENIIHENAHALEAAHSLEIYSDSKIEIEFLGKRHKLFHLIRQEGYVIIDFDPMKVDYTKEIDDFLYKEVGYEKLENLINGIFLNPYAVTSLREYFASGMEKYLLSGEDRRYLSIISPALVRKIEELINGY